MVTDPALAVQTPILQTPRATAYFCNCSSDFHIMCRLAARPIKVTHVFCWCEVFAALDGGNNYMRTR